MISRSAVPTVRTRHRWQPLRCLWLAGLALAMLTSLGATPPHPYHVSLTEIEFNSDTGNFEVALCVWPVDLEQALAEQESRPIDLQREKELDALLARYIQPRFRVLPRKTSPAKPATAADDAGGSTVKPSKLQWVGHEVSLKRVWLYFEISGDRQQTEWSIENRVFFELNDDQQNYIHWTVDDQYETRICMPQDRQHPLSTERLLQEREVEGFLRPGAAGR